MGCMVIEEPRSGVWRLITVSLQRNQYMQQPSFMWREASSWESRPKHGMSHCIKMKTETCSKTGFVLEQLLRPLSWVSPNWKKAWLPRKDSSSNGNSHAWWVLDFVWSRTGSELAHTFPTPPRPSTPLKCVIEMIKPSWKCRKGLGAALWPFAWKLQAYTELFPAWAATLKAGFGISTPSCGCTSRYGKALGKPFFLIRKSVSLFTPLLRMAFSSHGQNLSLLHRWKGGEPGRRLPRATTGSPVIWGASLAAGAAPAGHPGPACCCRAGLSLLGLCLQPGCVGCLGPCGSGSGMGSMAAQPWGPRLARGTQHHMGRVKMAHGKLGFSPVLEEDLRAPLNSVLPCFLASWRACLCLIALVISPFLFVGGRGEGRWGTFYLKPEVFVIFIEVN